MLPLATPPSVNHLQQMHELGFSLFPLKHGSKIPALKWEKYQTERATLAQVEEWFCEGYLNFGVATGAISGVVVLDLDNAETIAEAERRGLPDTISVNTPRGRHVYFRHSEAHPTRNTVRLGDMSGADFRGDGGYVVAVGSHYVPTAHEMDKAKLAGTYTWHRSPDLSDFALAPDWLLELLAIKPADAASRTRPGDAEPRRSGYAAVGWAEVAVRGELAALMAAPDGARNDTLNTVAMKIGQIVGGGHFDEREAKQRLMTMASVIGMNAAEIGPTLASGFGKGLQEPRHPPERGHVATAAEASKAPTDFRPLDISVIREVRRPAPVFPLAPFGPAWGAWITAAADRAGAPVDYVALSLLVTSASVIGNARHASPWGGWIEPTILWGLLTGIPGAGKTPALKPVLNLVTPIDTELARGFDETLDNYAEKVTLAKLADARWEATVKDAIKNGVAPPKKPANATAPAKPVCPSIKQVDVTPEMVALQQQAMPKGNLLLRDEFAGFLGNFGRYGGDGDRQFYLECFNGGEYRVERVKHDKPIVIEHLALSLLGGMQPARFADIMATDPNDGLLGRFLIAFPDAVAPRRPETGVEPIWPVNAVWRLHKLTLAGGAGGNEPLILPFSEAAASLIDNWRRNADPVEGEMLQAHHAKMPGMCIRIALVLEHLWWSASETLQEPREISAGAVEAAITLLDDYFKPSALRLYGDAATPKDLIATALLARWIVQTGTTAFNAREVRNGKGCPPMLRDAKQMQAACDGLVDAGWLLAIGGRADGGAGRQPRDYRVNPALSETLAA